MPRTKLPELIIQNFRSWAGKSYVELNEINFLFGTNSSGKSSVISALALLKQSLQNGRHGNHSLQINGDEVNLGKIQTQLFSSPETSSSPIFESDPTKIEIMQKNAVERGGRCLSTKFVNSMSKLKWKCAEGHTWLATPNSIQGGAWCPFCSAKAPADTMSDFPNLSEQIGFGYRVGNLKRFLWQVSRRALVTKKLANRKILYNSATAVDYDQFDHNLLKDVEVCLFYSPNTSKLVGIELNTEKHCLLRVSTNETGSVQIEVCQDEHFWKGLVEKAQDRFKFDGTIEDLPDSIKNHNDTISRAMNRGYEREIKEVDLRIFDTNLDYARQKLELENFDLLISRSNRESEALNLRAKQKTIKINRSKLPEIISKFEEKLKHLKQEKYNVIEQSFEDQADYRKWTDFSKFKEDLRCYGKVILRIPEIDNKIPLKDQVDDIHEIDLWSIIYAFADNRSNGWLDSLKDHGGQRSSPQFSGFQPLAQFIGVLFERVLPGGNFFDLSMVAFDSLTSTLSELDQIGPHRERPDRVSLIDPNLSVSSVGKMGQHLPNLLHACSKKDLKILNQWLQKLEIPYTLDKVFYEKFNIQEIILIDEYGLKLSIADVGYGISQVLPILVQSVLSRGRLISIEQPELHIHPRLQANLADLFIWSAGNNRNRFIIETHSEHIILRLMRRQREPSNPNNNSNLQNDNPDAWRGIFESININIIEKIGDPSHSVISKLKINKKGEFSDQWPGGFFEERYEEKGLI